MIFHSQTLKSCIFWLLFFLLTSLILLNQVDRLVGKNHLFKRSIMLIKCWCYYESRILGAHHGLISTYGLEILILYIFQFFHASLNTPVAVIKNETALGILYYAQVMHRCFCKFIYDSCLVAFRFSIDFWIATADLIGRSTVSV